MSNLTTVEALELISKLQGFISQQERVGDDDLVKDLQTQVESLETEKSALLSEINVLRQQNAAWRLFCKTNDMTIPEHLESPTHHETDYDYAARLSSGSVFTHDKAVLLESEEREPIDERNIERETASHGESTSYDIVNERREQPFFEIKPILKSSKKLIHRTSSRDRARGHRTDSASLYELSTDIADKAIECLEKKYGGKEISNQAARAIQQCYRHWILNKGFKRVRAYSGRKRSLTMPEKQFQKLKQKSLVFYGPDNPVMIVDGEFESSRLAPIAQCEENSDGDSSLENIQGAALLPANKQNIVEIAQEEGLKIFNNQTADDSDDEEEGENEEEGCSETENERCSETENEVDSADDNLDSTITAAPIENTSDKEQSADSTDFIEEAEEAGEEQEEKEEDVVDSSRSTPDMLLEERDDEKEGRSDDEKEERSDAKKRLSRSSSGSSSYDIIDDSCGLIVVGKPSVGLQDGTVLEVDKVYDDSPDGISMSTQKLSQPNIVETSMHKRQFRIGINLFNWKPEAGIQYLIDNGHIGGDVRSIAGFLRKQTSVSKQKISEYFGNLRNEFNMQVLTDFGKSFDFVDKDVDEALRQFQSYFKLTGEAQTVEKFLQIFSDRYVECNPGRVSDNPDTILLLAFALAMLNTDLHNQNVKRRMTPEEFMKNLRGTDNGNDLDQTMLRNMYNRIQKNEFATGADHTTQLHQIENSFVGKVPNLSVSHRQFVKLFTVEEVFETNRKDSKEHHRLAFLFNDLLLLAKPRGKSGSHGAGHNFACKASYSLLGKKVAEFSNEHYSNGVVLVGRFDNKVVATFNVKDPKIRKSFVEELDEYIRETHGMENIRLALSKVNQLTWHNRRKDDGRTKSLLIQDLPQKMDSADTTSLTDLRLGGLSSDTNSLSDNMGKINASASMGDINEDDIETDEVSGMVRTNSASSLEPRTTSSEHRSFLHPNSSNSLPKTTTSVKTLFNHFAPKFRKSMTHADRRRSTSPSSQLVLSYDRRDKSPSPPPSSSVERNPSPSLLDRSDKQTTLI